MKIIVFIFFLVCSLYIFADKKEKIVFKSNSIHQFSMNDINGEPFNFKTLEGKIVLIVNVASNCGFTNQYGGLETLYKTYKSKEFVILGIPSNDFGNQEPGNEKDIKEFCKLNYNTTFPLLQKSKIKGKDAIDLYKFLTSKKNHPKTGGAISWNFNKFLIDGKGHVRHRFSSFTKPMSKKITKKIEELLKELGEKNEKNN